MNVADPLRAHAVARPDRPAVIFPKGRLSWSQLDALIDASALHFRAHGLSPGDRVGVTVQHPVLHLAAALGLARLGVAHVALPSVEASAVRAEVARKLGLVRVVADAARHELPGVPALGFDRPPKPVPGADKPDAGRDDTERTWLFLQSSGTTGTPKFAELSHAAAMVRSQRFVPLFDCGADDVMWPVSRLDFVVAKQRAVYALQAGAALCLPVDLPMGPELLPFLRTAGVTLACGTPSHLVQLLELDAGPRPLPTLRAFEVRSATISERLRATFKSRFSPDLYVVYGTNEGESLAIASPELQARVPNTVGRATGSIEIDVVDDDGRPVGPDVVGEVRARGPGVITAYVDNPEATRRSFRDGWFHPGDLGSLTADGALVLHGRKDDMMIFDGVNIYPAEIENALLEHPAVREAAAFALRHETFQDVPAAAVVLDTPVDEQALVRHCIDRIGHKFPRKIRILKAFPRNAMGKILKRALATWEDPA